MLLHYFCLFLMDKNPAAEWRQARVGGVTVGELMKAWGFAGRKSKGLRCRGMRIVQKTTQLNREKVE